MTLKEACEKVFGGAISVASLKAEAGRGNLTISKIGRAYFTTRRHLDEMEVRCRVKAQAPTFGTTKPEVRGQSSTANGSSALAALKASVERRKKNSKRI
jgi:hypothetical protein